MSTETDVFILGAGFSYAAGEIPLMAELMNIVKEEYKEKFKNHNNSFLDQHSDLEFMLSTLFLKSPFDTEAIYFEKLSTYHRITEIIASTIIQAQNRYSTNLEKLYSAIRQLVVFMSQVQEVKAYVSPFTHSTNYSNYIKYLRELKSLTSPINCSWFSSLVRYLADQTYGKKNIITFNYDTLFELEFFYRHISNTVDYLIDQEDKLFQDIQQVSSLKVDLQGKYESFASGTLYPQFVPPSLTRLGYGLYAGSSDYEQLKLFKLHGSINFVWDSYNPSSTVFRKDEYSKGLKPFIIPPILDKSTGLNHSLLRLNWTMSHKALKQAKRIFILGYSVPLTDFSTRTMLFDSQFDENGNVKEDLEVYAVNIDSDNNLKANLEAIFNKLKKHQIKYDFYLPAEQNPLEKLCQQLYSKPKQILSN